jgi:ClpP class serine protease
MFLLANLEEYHNCLATSPNLVEPSVSAFQEGRSSAMDYHIIGTDAVIPVCGPLSYKYDFWTWLSDGCAYQILQQQIIAAAGNEDVGRIILLMDTPGGEVTGIVELSEVMGTVSKQMVAVVDPMCASAGLWIASQCDRVVMMKSGSIGSLGVQIIATSMAKMYEDAGVDIKFIRAAISPKKNLANSLEPFSEEAVEHLQSRVDMWGEQFLAAVAQGRGVSVSEALDKFGQGDMLFGEEALEAGLVDEIGSLQSVLMESKPKSKVSFSAKNIRR